MESRYLSFYSRTKPTLTCEKQHLVRHWRKTLSDWGLKSCLGWLASLADRLGWTAFWTPMVALGTGTDSGDEGGVEERKKKIFPSTLLGSSST